MAIKVLDLTKLLSAICDVRFMYTHNWNQILLQQISLFVHGHKSCWSKSLRDRNWLFRSNAINSYLQLVTLNDVQSSVSSSWIFMSSQNSSMKSARIKIYYMYLLRIGAKFCPWAYVHWVSVCIIWNNMGSTHFIQVAAEFFCGLRSNAILPLYFFKKISVFISFMFRLSSITSVPSSMIFLALPISHSKFGSLRWLWPAKTEMAFISRCRYVLLALILLCSVWVTVYWLYSDIRQKLT